MSAVLSDYEKRRLATIEQNQKVLRDLGLEDKLVPKKAASSKKPSRKCKPDDPDYVPQPKRTTRVTGAQRSRVDLGSSSEDDSDDDYRTTRRPVKVAKRPPQPSLEQTLPSVNVEAADAESSVVVEAAKTGRSKCRGCFEMLEQGAPRVGMHSWMVGRQVIVWQHPACFWRTLSITAEPTGRGKCKATKASFAAGELRLSAQAHTTTNHYKLACAHDAVLDEVRRADPPSCDVCAIEGYDQLDADARRLLNGSTTKASTVTTAGHEEEEDELPNVGETPSTRDALLAPDEGGESSAVQSQPAKGRVLKMKAKVCWKFAGHLCFGTLLPAQETTTHCYARTHKGNTKTLTKGGASWWVVEG